VNLSKAACASVSPANYRRVIAPVSRQKGEFVPKISRLMALLGIAICHPAADPVGSDPQCPITP
jgi:hypothetical protein